MRQSGTHQIGNYENRSAIKNDINCIALILFKYANILITPLEANTQNTEKYTTNHTTHKTLKINVKRTI